MPNIVAAGMLGIAGAHPNLRPAVVGIGAKSDPTPALPCRQGRERVEGALAGEAVAACFAPPPACRGRLGEVRLLILRRSAWFPRVMPTECPENAGQQTSAPKNIACGVRTH